MTFTYHDEFKVAVPASEAFTHIGRRFFENHSRWDPMVVRMKQTSPNPIGVGTTGREWRKIGPRTTANDVRVVVFEPERTFGFEATSGPLRERATHTIDPEPCGCHIAVELTFTPATRSMRLFEPMMRRIVLRNVRRNMVRLRDALTHDGA